MIAGNRAQLLKGVFTVYACMSNSSIVLQESSSRSPYILGKKYLLHNSLSVLQNLTGIFGRAGKGHVQEGGMQIEKQVKKSVCRPRVWSEPQVCKMDYHLLL
jgi:hypothetical protein